MMNCKSCGKPIDEHVVGRELDACMAKGVMGWSRAGLYHVYDEKNETAYELMDTNQEKRYSIFVDVWYPSVSIADVWKAVLHIRETDPFNVGVSFCEHIAEMFDATQDDWVCDVYNVMMGLNPYAICIAILKAVSEKDLNNG